MSAGVRVFCRLKKFIVGLVWYVKKMRICIPVFREDTGWLMGIFLCSIPTL